MLAKGKNALYIQEKLRIGSSTAKTHTHRIYQKMGISSQQLLIDVVDNETCDRPFPSGTNAKTTSPKPP